MINPDILRIMAELYTFTAEDLAEALECPVGTVGGLLPGWTYAGYVTRFKVERTYMYALSSRGERMVAKLPPIDPDERCLLVEMCAHEDTIVKGWIAPGDIVHTQHICQNCGDIVKWTSRQNWYRGWEGATMKETDHLK